jgi:hypothetical protein
MPENASRFAAALFDQFEDEHQVADWGGDDLFTRMPRPRAVDSAPPPRFRPSLAEPEASPDQDERRPAERPLVLVDPPADRRRATTGEEWSGLPDRRREERSDGGTAEAAMRARAERLGIAVVDGTPAHRWDETGAMIEAPSAGRRTKLITGRPGETPRPLPTVTAARRRPQRTAAEWVGPKPERLVAWAFALGLVLIVIAILTAGS